MFMSKYQRHETSILDIIQIWLNPYSICGMQRYDDTQDK